MAEETLSEKRRRAAMSRKKMSGGTNGGSGGAREGSGRPRSADRCPCGEMTKKRAEARGHKC